VSWGTDGSVFLAHPARLFCDTLGASLAQSGVSDIRFANDLESVLAGLSARPARLTVAAPELANGSVASLVTVLLEGGSTSVVVLAPEVREPEMLAALEAGALGYVSREEQVDRLVYDVRGALNGQACLPRDKLAPVLRLLIDRRRAEDQRTERLRRLSRREHEVLTHLGRGLSNDEIASALFVSRATVRTHVQNILRKLQVHSRLEAIAVAQGLPMPSQERST